MGAAAAVVAPGTLCARAIVAKRVALHDVDFDCLVCRRNFDLTQRRGKLGSIAFVEAHIKSCALQHGLSLP